MSARVGIANDLDLRLRYEQISVPGTDWEPVDVIGFGPKIALRQNQSAL